MTGSGKTTAALEMLSLRDLSEMAQIIIAHKPRDPAMAKLPAERLPVNPVYLPDKGLHIVHAQIGKAFRQPLEDLLFRIFKHRKIGLYIDEGHLLGMSDAVRTIMVAGRTERVPMMWTSQRASDIDTFIWSQSSFYRVFNLQTIHDVRRFEENFPIAWEKPDPFHSYYYDIGKDTVFYVKPAGTIEKTIERLDDKLRHHYRAI